MKTTLESLCAGLGGSVGELDLLVESIADGTAYVSWTNRHHRKVYAPLGWWDSVTKELNRFLKSQIPYVAPSHVFGFVKGRSTLQNARNHLGKDCVLRIDIQKFFPSIGYDRLTDCLTKWDFTPPAARAVANLASVDGGLAIGLSTSPFLSNLVMTETDDALLGFSTSSGLTFTRYVDDLIFSGSMGEREEREATASSITSILAENGWSINESKTRFMRRGGPQFVTGLYVGNSDHPHAPREIKRSLRWVTRMIEKVGYETYMRDFHGEALGHNHRYLLGLARYVAAVDGRVGVPLLQRLTAVVPEPEYDEDDGEFYAILDNFD